MSIGVTRYRPTIRQIISNVGIGKKEHGIGLIPDSGTALDASLVRNKN